MRQAQIRRKTTETDVRVELVLDGSGKASIATGVGFLDHMLTLLARHSLTNLKVAAKGDLAVDAHHTVEDVGLGFGQALAEALGDKRGIARYGSSTVPMDEALVLAAVDLGGRPALAFGLDLRRRRVGDFDTELVQDFFQAVANAAKINVHLVQMAGRNTHHLIEAAFKAFARALAQAVAPDPRVKGVPSSKGKLT